MQGYLFARPMLAGLAPVAWPDDAAAMMPDRARGAD